MSDPPPGIERAFRLDSAFEPDEAGFRMANFPFDAYVTLSADDEELRYNVEFELPTLNAVVTEAEVPAIIHDGWKETLERRLNGAAASTSAIGELTVTVVQDGEQLRLTMVFAKSIAAAPAVDAVRALATYVEGTYLQGIIPGYSYASPVAELLERARGEETGST